MPVSSRGEKGRLFAKRDERVNYMKVQLVEKTCSSGPQFNLLQKDTENQGTPEQIMPWRSLLSTHPNAGFIVCPRTLQIFEGSFPALQTSNGWHNCSNHLETGVAFSIVNKSEARPQVTLQTAIICLTCLTSNSNFSHRKEKKMVKAF